MAGYQHDEDDDFADDKGGDLSEEEDLSDVSDSPPLPTAGWYRAKILSISKKPAKSGAAMRTIIYRLKGTDNHDVTEYLAIGTAGKGGEIASRKYKLLARATGVEEDRGKFKFTAEDLLEKEIYLRVEVEKGGGKFFDKLVAVAYSPLSEPPEEMAPAVEDDSSPF